MRRLRSAAPLLAHAAVRAQQWRPARQVVPRPLVPMMITVEPLGHHHQVADAVGGSSKRGGRLLAPSTRSMPGSAAWPASAPSPAGR